MSNNFIEAVLDDTGVERDEDARPEIRVDDDRLVIEAKREIVIRCGESSITLTRSGKILIRGRHIVSRSSGANLIRGATIEMN